LIYNQAKNRRKTLNQKEFIEAREEMESILSECVLGYLGLSLDDTPYVVPLNYFYTEGKILFHCALEGKKLDYLKRNQTVCFTVARQFDAVEQHEEEDSCEINSESVMCFGKARIIEDIPERHKALNAFNQHFDPGSDEITLKRTKGCCVVEINIDEMTGKQVINQKSTYWRYRF
jgi:nitroimidazol reductase NimA-like FMN-containing flavoprotein (pyridoxamine 5'-phosphate oxidase superfamily)